MNFKVELAILHKTQVELRGELMATGRFTALKMPEISMALNGVDDSPKSLTIRFESTKIIERWKKECFGN